MADRLRVTVYDGKYTVIQEESGGMRFLRYGEPWSDPDEQIRYGNMILAMAYEIDELRVSLEAMRQERDRARVLIDMKHVEIKRLNESLERVQASFDTTLRSAGRVFTGRRIVNLDHQNERSQ